MSLEANYRSPNVVQSGFAPKSSGIIKRSDRRQVLEEDTEGFPEDEVPTGVPPMVDYPAECFRRQTLMEAREAVADCMGRLDALPDVANLTDKLVADVCIASQKLAEVDRQLGSMLGEPESDDGGDAK